MLELICCLAFLLIPCRIGSSHDHVIPRWLLYAGAADEVIRGMSSLYAELVQPHRTFRVAFIAKLLKKFDAACNLHSHGARKADIKCAPFCPWAMCSLTLIITQKLILGCLCFVGEEIER